MIKHGFLTKTTASAKIELAEKTAKKKSLAKTAQVPKGKAVKPELDSQNKWADPGRYAHCRRVAGNDMAAGLLLYRILYLWVARKTKLERLGKKWLAMSRSDWARSAGLSEDEMKDRALPRVRNNCHAFVDIRQMKLGTVKKLWISVDEALLNDAFFGPSSIPHEMFEAELNGSGIFPPPGPKNAYAEKL
jgi:hypothetical protein